jgi:D-3-phosphoglycerate dehydrogenase
VLERTLLEEAGLEVNEAQCRTPAEVIRAGQGVDALLIEQAPITAEVLAALPNLRLISCCGVGYNTVDIAAAQARGVWVANVPDATTGEVAIHTLALILALIRHVPFYDRDVRAGRWHYESTGVLPRPATLTLGIVGLGRIGCKLAEVARPIFGRILAYDPYLPPSAWPDFVHRVDLTTLLQQSNILSLHLPLNDETRWLVNAERLALLPPGGYLVNTGRGALLDLVALQQALDGGQLAGAALDVWPEEPPPPDHPLLHHPRVLLTPHAAFYSQQGMEELRRKYAQNVVAWLKEGRPKYVVVEGRSQV